MTNEELASSELPVIVTRYAMREDLAEVLEMYINSLIEINDYIEPISPKKCAETVMQSWLRAPCILLVKLGQIIGFAGFSSAIPKHSDSVILEEYMFYIKPEHRSLKAAKVMSDASIKMADELKLPLYMSHMLKGHDANIKDKFLKRWGYETLAIGVRYVRR